MKIIVTGGAGFIGSNLVDSLVEKDFDVIVIDNQSADCHDQFYHNNGASYYKCDINDYDLIERLFIDADYVFHLAAEARIQPTIENPRLAVQTNVLGTCNILEASRKHNVKRVIYSSTSSAYGLKNDPPLVETMDRDCLNPYSVSKCAGEDLCKMYHSLYGLETVIFRYFNVYGERQPTKGQYAPVIGIFQRQYANGEPMTVVGDGLQTRDYVHVSDVVEANILMALHEDKSCLGEIFNVGTGHNYSVLDIVFMIGSKDADYIHIQNRLGEARNTLADNKKLKSFGWTPKVNLKEHLVKRIIDRTKENV
jgi:UDP-glucose 4-epimerase